ncbi:MAG: glycoside hydrolase 5 family protein [Methanococcaceae archaeon]
MRLNFALIISIPFLFGLSSCSNLFIKEKPEYVKVSGSNFELNGKEFYVSGSNFWYGGYLGSTGETGDRDRLIRELDQMQSNGINNLRILGTSQYSIIKKSLKPAIQSAPGQFDAELLDGLDFLLSEMQKRGMRAVIFITNYWEWSGGMAQYNAWSEGKALPDPYESAGGFDEFMEYSASFYKNAKANDLFRKDVYSLITRKNKYSGYYYYDDPTIMTWELANEPRPGNPKIDNNLDAFYKWIDETSKYIHSIDPNHLVCTGSEGLVGSTASEEVFLKAHKSQYVDYLTFHMWPKNWSWIDPEKFNETYDSAKIKSIDYIDKHISLARKLNKPIILEEFGIPREGAKITENSPVTTRDRFYKEILTFVVDSAAAETPLAGFNFWGWGGEGRPKNADGMWHKGDPLTCDPPHEPQGYNSIYNTDASTLNIIKEQTERLKQLSEREIKAQKKTQP